MNEHYSRLTLPVHFPYLKVFNSKTAELLSHHQVEIKQSFPKEGQVKADQIRQAAHKTQKYVFVSKFCALCLCLSQVGGGGPQRNSAVSVRVHGAHV